MRLFLALSALVFGWFAASAALAQPAAGHLRVLATHDFHGALLPREYPWSENRPVGGAVALHAYMTRAETDCACPTVRLDGGDQMQGTLPSNLVFGASTVAMFNELGLDAAALGNHELDWGLETLQARLSEAEYAWLAANVFRRDNGARPDWTQPYTLIERDGIRLGVIGYATRSTPSTLRPATTADYEFREGYAAIRDVLDAVWQEEPDFVAIVAHAGGECRMQGCTGEMAELAAQLPQGRVHLIVGGHDHSAAQGVVNGIPIMRAGSGTALGVIDLFRQPDQTFGFTMFTETLYADTITDDGTMAALLAPYFAEADRMGKTEITTLAETLPDNGDDRRLGSLIAESVRLAANADIGLQNPGGIRADLMAGSVSYEDVYKVLPFGNEVVKMVLTGAQLRQLAGQTGAAFYYANLVVTRDESGEVSMLSLADGTAMRDDATYTLALPDFLADGGDGLAMLVSLPREAAGITLLDATIAQLRTPAP